MSVSDELLNDLKRLWDLGDPPPWTAMVEGRDHSSGDSFIQVGEDDDRREEVFVSRDSGPASRMMLDLIAASRTFLPLLIEEIRVLRSQLGESRQ